MENVIIELVNEYFSTLHNPKNDTETSLPTDNIRGLWTALNRINSSSVENTSSLIQWNDSWLITVLKNEWYKRKLDTQTHDDDIARLTDQLDEILTNEKHYFSAVKRGYDFALIDNEFKKKIIKNSSAFSNYPQLSLGKKFIETITKTPPQAEQKFFVLRMFHKMIWPELKDAICKSDYLDKLIDPLEQIISSCAKTAKREFNQTMNGQIIVDVMIGMKNNKAIKADSVNLYRPYSSNDNQEQVITLKETSNMDSILQLFIMYSPLFYVYIKKSRSAPEKINANLYLQILGEKLGDYIIKKIKKMRKNEMSAHRK